MLKYDLPVNKFYSPIAIVKLFSEATAKTNIESVPKLGKYKSIREMWHASFLALAIHKKFKTKFYIGSSDSPDIYFITEENNEKVGFPVEVVQLFDYKQNRLDDNYDEIVEKIWKEKSNKRYGNCHLLVVNRMGSPNFNVTRFTKLTNAKKWNFERIWLGLFRNKNKDWTFFEIFPCSDFAQIGSIDYNLDKDKQFLY